jgi:hypothetical protein
MDSKFEVKALEEIEHYFDVKKEVRLGPLSMDPEKPNQIW